MRKSTLIAIELFALFIAQNVMGQIVLGKIIDSTLAASGYPSTQFGVLYALWHCPASRLKYDISEALAGIQPWGPVPEFHYWDEPQTGYYCLSRDDNVLRYHAVMLRDAGIDFIIIDSTNHAYTDTRSDRPKEMVMEPFERLLAVWSTVENAPQIVPWVPVTADGDMIYFFIDTLSQYPNMHFNFLGKPLLLVVDHPGFPTDESRLRVLESDYTIRKMWGIRDPGEDWSFLQHCTAGFKNSQGIQKCNQKVTIRGGSVEQISVSAAYQETMMSDKRTAVPKFQGRTL